ncbi:MAG: YdcH family protein [Alphaproteobacteria bacterium]
MQEEEEELNKMLEELRTEHRDLDIIIDQLGDVVPVDFLRMQRLKKRKLFIKDQISKLESMLLPDIIA